MQRSTLKMRTKTHTMVQLTSSMTNLGHPIPVTDLQSWILTPLMHLPQSICRLTISVILKFQFTLHLPKARTNTQTRINLNTKRKKPARAQIHPHPS